MMVPTQQHAVAGVGGAAVGVVGDVVDLTPGGGDPAAGDHAAAVAEGDGAALVPVEHPVLGADPHDAAGLGEGDALDDTATGDVPGGEDGRGLVAPVRPG